MGELAGVGEWEGAGEGDRGRNEAREARGRDREEERGERRRGGEEERKGGREEGSGERKGPTGTETQGGGAAADVPENAPFVFACSNARTHARTHL